MGQKTKESNFQAVIVSYASLQGCKTFHPFDSRKSVEGWPDLHIVRADFGAKYRELKILPNWLSVAQEEWLLTLLDCGLDAAVYTQYDWSLVQWELRKRPAPSPYPKCEEDGIAPAVKGSDLCRYHFEILVNGKKAK